MSQSAFVVAEERSSSLLTLIVDRKGVFGPSIAKKIQEDGTTVLVTTAKEESHDNVLVVPYTKTIPEIPEGNYTHMFFVWDGKSESLHVLEPLLQKASLDRAQFIFVTDYHCYNEKLVRFIHQQYSRALALFTGDVFGNDGYESVVTKFFHEAQEKGAILLENVGLKHVYPVEFHDVVTEIVKLGFGTEKGKIFLACQRHGMTELSLVHVLQKVDPLIKMDFKKEERESVFLPEGEYLFDTHYDIVRKIQDAYVDFTAAIKSKKPTNQEPSFSPAALYKEKRKKQKTKKWWVVAVLLVLLLLSSPILFTLAYGSLGVAVLYAGGNVIKTGNYQQAENFSATAEGLFSVSLSANGFAEKELNVLFLSSVAHSLTEGLQMGQEMAMLLEDGAKAAVSFSSVAKGKSVTPSADFLTGTQAIKNALEVIAASPVQDIGGISLSNISQEVQPLSSILDISPSLFGFPQKKTYMVLLQNNMELRPGGGFIGSYALVTLDQGRVTSFQIHDVYDADGQLKGHVEPPYVIRRYIPQVHWYLRDSNFDVDFSQDAANAAFFLSLEIGQKVDGVIGVDLTFVKDVLNVIGPVYVPEYNQTVNADNLFFLTETHAEKNSFAGSTQKKDFLSALFQALQKKINTESIRSPKAILGLLGALQSKDIVFGFSDPLIQDVFTVNGLSSTLWDGRKQDAGVVRDFTGINEANIGVDKANYFVTRAVRQDMDIDKTGSISGKLSITYTNSSKGNTWPGGDYKNYLRLILPSGAALQSVQIDDVAQSIVPAVTDFHVYEAKGFVAPKDLEVDSTTENGKQLYGFVTTVKAGATQKIVVMYTLPKIDTSSSTLTYNGWLFKQPGVDAYPYDFTLSVPNNFSLLQKPGWVQGKGNTISFSKPFGQDMQFNIVFSQK